MRRRISAAALPIHRHSLLQIAADGVLLALAYFLAFELRFNGRAPERYESLFDRTIVWVALGGMVVLVASRVYERRWRYSSQRDYWALLRGVVAVVVLTVLAVAVLRPVVESHGAAPSGHTVGVALPNGETVIFALLCVAFLGGARVLASTLHERRPLAALLRARHGERSVLIVGAGDGGRLVLREILRNREPGLNPVGFLDDDPRKQGLRIDGVRVRGDTTGRLRQVLDEAEPDEVIIAIPSAPGSTRARVVRGCRARGIPVRTLPTVFELLRDLGSPALSLSGGIAQRVREVRVEDVLGRDPIHVELRSAGAYLTGEVVLVTGAGGSIGAELCRQIAQVHPRAIVLVDHAEDNLFAIKSELEDERHVPPAAIRAVLADCKEAERIAEVFAEHRPSVVFHAAAYKHVGLMESNPIEAIRNNTIATSLVATLAGESGADRFVLVSTDKAVEPATVMGASKALAELSLELTSARCGQTRYAAVRFGNVLGSSGSVVPIFRRQIARGGPVTVTDERMERYFMTIPEAVQLIIRAGSMVSPDAPAHRRDRESGAELFVLEMGEPVKIVELARAMIELSGLEPEKDIEIEIIGARPGEKLSEVLFADHERPMATEAERIVRVERRRVDADAVDALLSEVESLLAGGDPTALASRIVELAMAPWAPEQAGQSTPANLSGS
ncbi:MAG: polysaccharide biosynthesis protein [Solirubrobacteraceae bacterium]